MIFFQDIPQLVNAEDNQILEAVPSDEEVKQAVFNLNPDSAPGPDGFEGWFYKHAWGINGKDLTISIQYCRREGFIPQGFNANFLLLQPKVKNAKKAGQFRPIGLMNFSFKVITKVISTRLGSIIQKIISPQQGAFIKGRNIQEQIVLASELVNELNIKRRGGNLGIKIDITQAYDSLSWSFLFQVMRNFGFSVKWTTWLHTLLKSARMSMLLNGGPVGYFQVGRGLRQDKRNVKNLISVLKDYQAVSSQVVSLSKSKYFVGGTSKLRKQQIANECNIPLSSFPDKYLGVMLTPGFIKSNHVWNCVEKIQGSLTGWMGKLLSFQERLILVCSPYEEGGLGLRRLEIINNALLTKLWWKIQNSTEEWARFFQENLLTKNGEWIKYYKKSSILLGLKWVSETVKNHSRWIVGNGENNSVWRDTWIKDRPLCDMYPENSYMAQFPDLKVGNLIVEGEWVFPNEMLGMISVNELPVMNKENDRSIWCGTLTGIFTVSFDVECIRTKYPKLGWPKQTNQIPLCCDGASKENPGMAGYGIIARNSVGDCVIAIAGGMGIATNFFAEIMEILWEKFFQNVREWDFIHSYMELNFSADDLAKNGVYLQSGERHIYTSKPPFLVE
ncbi:uncharacterized protein LOC113351656 [Papaver somniferum]|uniref:uncharacterized protein LOC113351656 n=1 Tax=Papaver somniferum TaxID=3469 RepID=UPI000E6FD675|nr:uncharacterized protein LOC113351656 [Papaver somniferum]